MKRGALAIQAKLRELAGRRSLNETLKAMGMTCMSHHRRLVRPGVRHAAGHARQGAAGRSPGRRPRRARSPPAIAALTRLGKAEVGQKTLLDVLDPVQRVLAQRRRRRPRRARARSAPSTAPQATAQMDAIQGRASFLGERALGHVDPGSRSMALIIAAICDAL